MDTSTEDLKIARAAAEAALSVEGVRSLGRGVYAEAATYGAGEKVVGVVVQPEEVTVHVVVGYPPPGPLPEVAGKVRRRVAPHAGGRAASVVVEDLETSEEVTREGN